MPKLNATVKGVSTPKLKEALQVSVQGIVSTPTLKTFQKAMDEPISSGKDVILDFQHIRYINSSGLGELVRWHDQLQSKSKRLCLTRLNSDVEHLVAMLGLNDVLHIFPDPKAALKALDSGVEATTPERYIISRQEAVEKAKAAREAGTPIYVGKLPEAHVLLHMKADDFFTHFLARGLSGDTGKVSIVESVEQARQAIEEKGPVHVAILDGHLEGSSDICREMKTAPRNHLVSVLYIHPQDTSKKKAGSLRVMEDESLGEPFDVHELVALAMSEYHRCQDESILFVRELHLQFPAEEAALNDAFELIESLIELAGADTEEDASFNYAVREAIDNARRHGCKSDTKKAIELLYVLDKEKITITVMDEGPGFDYEKHINAAQQRSPLEQVRIRHNAGGHGGLGIAMMLRCCDKLEYVTPGNLIKLTKYV